MLERFMVDPEANAQAVVILAALVTSWIISLALILRAAPVPGGKSWYTGAPVVFTLLGLPAALDLLQTGGGMTLALAAASFAALVLNSAMALLRLAEKSLHRIVGIISLVEAWQRRTWAVPVLVAGGLAVAGYLTFVEVTDIPPACGPLGDCGSVQSSPYATLFGVLSVGTFGLAGYLAILAAWLTQQFGPEVLKRLSALAMWGMGIFGVSFSAYLTFLEPFVIGATCMWCTTSALFMILLLWASTPAAQEALAD